MWSRQNGSLDSTAPLGDIDLYGRQDVVQFITTVACLVAFSLLGGLISQNRKIWSDTITLAALISARQWRVTVGILSHLFPKQSYLYVIAVIALQMSIASQRRSSTSSKPGETTPSVDGFFLPPLIFPCRTTHTRMYPTKHSFGYSYLFVGIPIGWTNFTGSLLSTDLSKIKTWYSVHSDDYLARGTDASGLKSKLDAYLVSQGIGPDEYPHAYLVTAARFLGFSFNPVSFWYLYDRDKALAAMILEVNNTFDERRMYFIKRKSGTTNTNQDFSNEWTKDFHVSPFNDRDGYYSFTGKNPALNLQDIRIDNNIVLKSEEGKAKIIARVFSTEAAVNPAKVSALQSWLFVARWWWVGFMTNPRILREARMLWMKKLQVFYRPEVFNTSIGRNETTDEVNLEILFRDYLKHAVHLTNTTPSLEYVPAAGHDRGKSVHIGSQVAEPNISSLVQLKILTPAFYEEIAKANSISEAFERYCFDSAPGAKMAEVSDIAVMKNLLLQCKQDLATRTKLWTFTPMHVMLRRGNLCSSIGGWLMPWKKQEESARISDFDLLVAHLQPKRSRGYSNIVTRILLADRFAIGFMPLLKLYAWVTWCTLGLLATNKATVLLHQQWSISTCIEVASSILVLNCLRAIWNFPGTKDLS